MKGGGFLSRDSSDRRRRRKLRGRGRHTQERERERERQAQEGRKNRSGRMSQWRGKDPASSSSLSVCVARVTMKRRDGDEWRHEVVNFSLLLLLLLLLLSLSLSLLVLDRRLISLNGSLPSTADATHRHTSRARAVAGDGAHRQERVRGARENERRERNVVPNAILASNEAGKRSSFPSELTICRRHRVWDKSCPRIQ